MAGLAYKKQIPTKRQLQAINEERESAGLSSFDPYAVALNGMYQPRSRGWAAQLHQWVEHPDDRVVERCIFVLRRRLRPVHWRRATQAALHQADRLGVAWSRRLDRLCKALEDAAPALLAGLAQQQSEFADAVARASESRLRRVCGTYASQTSLETVAGHARHLGVLEESDIFLFPFVWAPLVANRFIGDEARAALVRFAWRVLDPEPEASSERASNPVEEEELIETALHIVELVDDRLHERDVARLAQVLMHPDDSIRQRAAALTAEMR